jgi:hypothetical protein
MKRQAISVIGAVTALLVFVTPAAAAPKVEYPAPGRVIDSAQRLRPGAQDQEQLAPVDREQYEQPRKRYRDRSRSRKPAPAKWSTSQAYA